MAKTPKAKPASALTTPDIGVTLVGILGELTRIRTTLVALTRHGQHQDTIDEDGLVSKDERDRKTGVTRR
jgi:hypothetical protein